MMEDILEDYEPVSERHKLRMCKKQTILVESNSGSKFRILKSGLLGAHVLCRVYEVSTTSWIRHSNKMCKTLNDVWNLVEELEKK